MRNYVLYGKSRFGMWLNYAFLDVPKNLAVSVLVKHGVRCRVEHVLTREDAEYILVQMKVRRKDKQQFLAAMEDLKTKMLICGYRDYVERSGALIRELEDIIIEEALQDKALMKKMGLEGQTVVIVDDQDAA